MTTRASTSWNEYASIIAISPADGVPRERDPLEPPRLAARDRVGALAQLLHDLMRDVGLAAEAALPCPEAAARVVAEPVDHDRDVAAPAPAPWRSCSPGTAVKFQNHSPKPRPCR